MTPLMKSDQKILIVDDELDNLSILQNYLEDADYQVDAAPNGYKAMALLEKAPKTYPVILLDWMMPSLSGLEVLEQIRSRRVFKEINTVMQTARARPDEILQGIEAGAWYYLTKPFDEETLLAIVETALRDRVEQKKREISLFSSSSEEVKKERLLLQKAKEAAKNRFVFRTFHEAYNISTLLAKLCPDPNNAVSGLTELLINAIEHGNLGISYKEKGNLLAEGTFFQEIDNRLASPEHAKKKASIQFEESEKEIKFYIKDEGDGFDHTPFLKMSPERATHTHGRGIAMARLFSFDKLKYCGNGNEVVATIQLNGGKNG